MAQVTYQGVSQVRGQLFTGKKFFLVQRLPTRSRFISDIEANGGLVVRLENQADYLIADHMRKDAPAGSLSYKFIEIAIRNGELPSPDDHNAGPQAGTVRSVGSTTIPGKSTRTPFTQADDDELSEYVRGQTAQGHMAKGLELYKQLALKVSTPRRLYWLLDRVD